MMMMTITVQRAGNSIAREETIKDFPLALLLNSPPATPKPETESLKILHQQKRYKTPQASSNDSARKKKG